MGLTPIFVENATRMGSHVLEVPLSGVPGVIEEAGRGLDGLAFGTRVARALPELTSLARPSAGPPEAVVSDAPAGLASTGSVVLADSYEDRRLGLLSFRQIVLLSTSSLLADLHAAVPLLQRWTASHQYITYASGPSRTSDIERVLTIGVHGPKELVVVLVAGWEGTGA